MTTQGRIEGLEQVTRTNDAMLNLLITIGDRREMLLEQQHEIRRDTQQTQRLWVRLAQRHGWLEDDDLDDEGA